jgi:23S rRNA (guanosine2251-2'-O)-methyltransferase
MRQLRKREAKKFFKEKVVRRSYTLYLLMENIQYASNVASLFRTADAAGVNRIYLTGISQQPPFGKDLKKTSRSKEESVEWMYEKDTGKILNTLKKQGFKILALEITDSGVELDDINRQIHGESKVCLVVGNEVYGVTNSTLEKADVSVYIPMYGKGASLNVATSAAIALFAMQ